MGTCISVENAQRTACAHLLTAAEGNTYAHCGIVAPTMVPRALELTGHHRCCVVHTVDSLTPRWIADGTTGQCDYDAVLRICDDFRRAKFRSIEFQSEWERMVTDLPSHAISWNWSSRSSPKEYVRAADFVRRATHPPWAAGRLSASMPTEEEGGTACLRATNPLIRYGVG